MLQGKNVLVVDDEVDLREIVASELEFMGAHVDQAGNITAADALLKEKNIDLIISDIRMPGGTGVDLLKTVKARNILNPPVILITGFADITPEEAYAEGAEALMNKPFQLDELIQVSGRLMLPLEERFSDEAKANARKIEYTSDKMLAQTADVGLGRGGFFIKVEHGTRFENAERIRFELKFQDTSLCGDGIVRWMKPSESDGKIFVGVEIIVLDKECTDFTFNHWRTSPGLSFIPKGH